MTRTVECLCDTWGAGAPMLEAAHALPAAAKHWGSELDKEQVVLVFRNVRHGGGARDGLGA